MSWLNVTSPTVFYAAAAALLGYLLYMMVRKRKGERPGFRDTEPEL
jgi:hypothetical protein